jgi:hypothetical protein
MHAIAAHAAHTQHPVLTGPYMVRNRLPKDKGAFTLVDLVPVFRQLGEKQYQQQVVREPLPSNSKVNQLRLFTPHARDRKNNRRSSRRRFRVRRDLPTLTYPSPTHCQSVAGCRAHTQRLGADVWRVSLYSSVCGL